MQAKCQTDDLSFVALVQARAPCVCSQANPFDMGHGTRAIVIGGSIAGMASARVLAESFREVLLLDRDAYPRDVGARAGVPQGRHAHALLGRGQRELEALFPGFVAAMLRAGAPMFDAGAAFAMRRALGWQAVGENGVNALWSSRDLLEFTVRSLLRSTKNLELRERCQVLGLRGDKARVGGVRVRSEGQGEYTLSADLVLDASGRNTQAERWLRELGLEPPAVSRVDPHAGYASRFYQPPTGERRPKDWWWRGLWVEGEPGVPRGAVVFPLEHERWIVTAVGFGDDVPPVDEPGFLAFLDRLTSPAVARAVALAEPLSDIHGNRSMANLFRRYDRWPAAPRGFLALGDSVCAFNPIYGQGMSAAAACAGILGACLRSRRPWPRLERRFFAAQAAFLTGVWNLATGADFQQPTTEGERPKMPPGVGPYLGLALAAAHHDPAVRRQLAPVFNLEATMQRFFEPRFMLQVLASEADRRLRDALLGEVPIADYPPRPAFR